jgi:phenylalanyl-tRNA synthetase beta chain
MRVSLHLAQAFSSVDLAGLDRTELLRRVGAQLGAVEETIDFKPRYDGVLVVRVVSCEQHPNADRLHVCLIDDGGVAEGVERTAQGYVQVVCGAPNVATGMFVAWLPPNSIVPSTYDDAEPFRLEARPLRGVVSNGMLASAHELGISDDHAGLLEITAEDAGKQPVCGERLSSYFGLDDFIIDCENKMFTHRPDCFGNLGVARELAGINGLAFRSPDWYSAPVSTSAAPVQDIAVAHEAAQLVPRFMIARLDSISVGPSPYWLQAQLMRVGIRPINNVVDVTNYVMHLTGQPLHAFDYDKLAATQIGPRMARGGEQLQLLNGKQIKLTAGDIVIATADRPVALAGVMGGSETEVDTSTTRIVLECATFDMYTIRRTSMRHGLFTDATTRYTKGQSPLQNDRVLAFAVSQLAELCGAQQVGGAIDSQPTALEPAAPVHVTADFINQRLGTLLSAEQIAELLANVEIPVDIKQSELTIHPPFWRTDLEIAEDIVEEIGRLYSFERLPIDFPLRATAPAKVNALVRFKQQLRRRLASAGANEVLTYSFVHGDTLRKAGTDPETTAYHLRNALSPDLQYYRTSLLPSLLDKVHANSKSDEMQLDDDNVFALFEIGTAHVKPHVDENGLPKVWQRIAFVFAAEQKTAQRLYSGSPYYMARRYLGELLPADAAIKFTALTSNDYPVTAPYALERSALVEIDGVNCGVVGELRADVAKAFKLPAFCAGFELDVEALHAASQKKLVYTPIARFPRTQQDITLVSSGTASYADAAAIVQTVTNQFVADRGYNIVVAPRDIYVPESADQKRFTFRLILSHPDKTLTTQEVNSIMEVIAKTAEEQLQ